MKNFLSLSLAVIVFSIIACSGKMDIEKEMAAIQAVIEEEKDAFFAQDFNRMAATWVQEPSSVKLYMAGKGPVEFLGWEKIAEHDKENIPKSPSEYEKMNCIFSDYNFNINDDNSWVVLKATWDGLYNGKQQHIEQTKILAFKKIEGKWKW